MKSKTDYGIAPPGTYKIVLESLMPIKGLNVLDVPAGSGGFAARMKAEGASCIALDINAPANHTPCIRADMNQYLPFKNETFDAITCLEGIEHIHDAFKMIHEFYRILRPEGQLAISTPNVQNMRSRIKFLLRGTLFWFDSREIHGVGHINVIPWFLFKHILKSSGFTIENVQANRSVFPAAPFFLARLMQRCFSKKNDDAEQNSPLMLSAEALIILARKKTL